MSQYSMLSIDLNANVTSDQRKKFYEHLEKKQWKKISLLTTLWYTNWKDGVSEQGMINTTRGDLEEAASYSGVAHYDAALANCGKPVVLKK